MTGFYTANFGVTRPFRSRVMSRHAKDSQTDGPFYNAPPPLWVHNNNGSFAVICHLLELEESKFDSDGAEFASHFLLHEIKTHGQQRQTHEEVQRTEDHLALRNVVQARPGYIIAETDRAERDEDDMTLTSDLLPQTPIAGYSGLMSVMKQK